MIPAINTDRLRDTLTQLGTIGAYDTEYEGIKGVRRLALTDEDKAGRELVISWMRDAGLQVAIDQIGNTYATRPGTDSSLAPVMAGSHVDSVPTGGRFDGALGVLGALEVIRTLNDHDIQTLRPVTIAFFTDEEGCRFGTDMLGSAVATGRIPLEHAWSLTDARGVTVKDELIKIGFLGDEEPARRKPHAFVECHVEQGPILIHEGFDLGVVTGVQGISWQQITLTGSPAHAGTTPTNLRHDAGLVAALINVKMREMCLSGDYGSEMRATMGVIRPHPCSVNVIPGMVTATIDLRNPDDEAMARAEKHLAEYLEQTAARHGVTVESRQTAKTPAVAFDQLVQEIIAHAAQERGLHFRHIMAGAGHDAQEWSRICPTAMIFVPGENDGISHNPLEYSSPQQCENGVNVLLHTILTLAEQR